MQVLIAALDCPDQAVQEGALVALLKRRTPAGGREILDRMPGMKPEWKTIIRHHRGRMTGALRDAILGDDRELCEKGCRAAVMFRDYDLVSTLLTALDNPEQANVELAAKTVLEIVQALCEELAGGRDPSDRRDPQMVRRYVLGSLESSIHRFGHHKRREVIEAFLLLVERDNAALRQVLQNANHAAYLAVIECLAKSPQRGVLRLLLSFLEDSHAAGGDLHRDGQSDRLALRALPDAEDRPRAQRRHDAQPEAGHRRALAGGLPPRHRPVGRRGATFGRPLCGCLGHSAAAGDDAGGDRAAARQAGRTPRGRPRPGRIPGQRGQRPGHAGPGRPRSPGAGEHHSAASRAGNTGRAAQPAGTGREPVLGGPQGGAGEPFGVQLQALRGRLRHAGRGRPPQHRAGWSRRSIRRAWRCCTKS